MAAWRTSSYSNRTNCVEVAMGDGARPAPAMANGNCEEIAFRRSAHCNGGTCVEVAVDAAVAVRDSKDPDGPVLAFTRAEWAEFTGRISAVSP